MDFDEIEALAAVLRDSPTLTDLEVRHGASVLRLRRPLPPNVPPLPRTRGKSAAAAATAAGKSETRAATNGTPASTAPAALDVTLPADNANGNGAARPLTAANVPAIITSPGTEAGIFSVKAGLVGLFRASRPPLAVGDSVREGQVVGQIEAMRLMNECFAPQAGSVVAILVEDGQPVEYGQPLFQIMPEAARKSST